jgi:hypothetical protein
VSPRGSITRDREILLLEKCGELEEEEQEEGRRIRRRERRKERRRNASSIPSSLNAFCPCSSFVERSTVSEKNFGESEREFGENVKGRSE